MSDETKSNKPIAEIQRLAEEFRLKAHLASMEAKTTWEEELKPQVRNLEKKFDKSVEESNLSEEITKLERRLRKLVEDVAD